MSHIDLPAPPIAGLRVIELGHGDEPLLQRFFEANPFYFWVIQGEPPLPDEASDEIHGQVPAGMPFTKKWVVGYLDAAGEVVALANRAGPRAGRALLHRMGYTQTTERTGIVMGKRTNTLRVMVKPLADNTLEQHLAQVERDRPDYPTA